ncbi:hypothetical protein CVD28_09740 [Bacillus sp. M6-12]|uniref:hypothetical protein n=1 Tax=Bacillus sp. M6-12 TaxID=2054166 RepID=UPI000C779678|nr:hypothetical protein [Bacillus sp. M6-12]PLS17959.1 hypothetical protein CVD28_09740 [Bacillus sp. M6-12]
MTTMTTITFANNQKELDRKIEQIIQDHERRNPASIVEISYLDPKINDIHFLPHQIMQLLIGIRIVDQANDNK